jgi:hypothetical protein
MVAHDRIGGLKTGRPVPGSSAPQLRGEGGSTRTHRAANTWLLVQPDEVRTVSADRNSVVGTYRTESGAGFYVESNYTITRIQ